MTVMEYINEENSPGVMEWYRAMVRLNREEGLFPELDDRQPGGQ